MVIKSMCGKYRHEEWWQQVGTDPAIFQGIEKEGRVFYTLLMLEEEDYTVLGAILNIRSGSSLKSYMIFDEDIDIMLRSRDVSLKNILVGENLNPLCGGKYNA